MTNCSGRCCELGSLVPPIFYMIDEIVKSYMLFALAYNVTRLEIAFKSSIFL